MIQRERVRVLLDTVPGVIGDGVVQHFGVHQNWFRRYARQAGVTVDRIAGLGYRKKISHDA